MLLIAAKLHGCSFYLFWVIKGKPTGWVKLHQTPLPHPYPPPHTQTQIKYVSKRRIISKWCMQ